MGCAVDDTNKTFKITNFQEVASDTYVGLTSRIRTPAGTNGTLSNYSFMFSVYGVANDTDTLLY